MITFLRKLIVNDRRGSIITDTALMLPVLLALLMGGIEVTRFALLQQKLNRAAVSMADLVAQSETLTAADLNSLFAAVQFVVAPFDTGIQSLVIVSSISATSGNPPIVDWQRLGAGSATATSDLGVEGANATLPAGFLVRDGESVIFAEVVYDFEPLLFTEFMASRRVKHTALFRPRFGALSTLN